MRESLPVIAPNGLWTITSGHPVLVTPMAKDLNGFQPTLDVPRNRLFLQLLGSGPDHVVGHMTFLDSVAFLQGQALALSEGEDSTSVPIWEACEQVAKEG